MALDIGKIAGTVLGGLTGGGAGAALSAAPSLFGGGNKAAGAGGDTTAQGTALKDQAAQQQLRIAEEDLKRDMYTKPLLDGYKKASESYQAIGR